jgi:hypothetical protein
MTVFAQSGGTIGAILLTMAVVAWREGGARPISALRGS